MFLLEFLTLLLPIMAILSLVAILPLILFSRLIFERYEKMYNAFLIGIASMFLLDLAYLAGSVGRRDVYKWFEFLSFFTFMVAVWLVLRNAASMFISAEANKMLESEVKVKTAELQARLSELTESRTALINMMDDLDHSQRELQRAYDDLKELDRVKSDIISNVSHELRTPITIAKGAIELAIEEGSAEERKDILERGKKALARLNQVVGDLVDIARLGRGKLAIGDVAIHEIINEVIAALSPLSKDGHVTLENEVKEALVIKGDADAIKKIIYSLLDNGIKFNRKGGRVRITGNSDDGNVKITVEDTGIGIPHEEFDNIFQPLYQVDATTTRKYPGTGMGLALVDNIVKSHGGRVLIESEVGKGSKFTVMLPKRQARKNTKGQNEALKLIKGDERRRG